MSDKELIAKFCKTVCNYNDRVEKEHVRKLKEKSRADGDKWGWVVPEGYTEKDIGL